jgi:hypothetical protein
VGFRGIQGELGGIRGIGDIEYRATDSTSASAVADDLARQDGGPTGPLQEWVEGREKSLVALPHEPAVGGVYWLDLV